VASAIRVVHPEVRHLFVEAQALGEMAGQNAAPA
jgi:hypothetical protein